MKKLISLALVLMMVFAMATIASAEGDWKFERKIEVICPWGVGGGADSALRPMATLLKEILGVEVEVVNVEGAGGVNGLEFANKQPADGYTFLLGTQSLIMQDLQGTTSIDFREEFQPISMLMHSINIIAASAKNMEAKGIETFSDLLEYIEANPFDISVGMMTATGADGASLVQTISGLDVLEVPYSTGSEMNAAIVGGHIDLMISGTDEISGLIESGDIVPLLALAENRMSIFPDMECTAELGIDSYIGPWRAIFAKAGTPEGAVEALIAAVEEARQSEDWQNFLKGAAYDERPIKESGEELLGFYESEYVELTEYLDGEGVLVKNYYE